MDKADSPKQERNSVLELLRLLAAFWILHQHNFTPIPRQTFAYGGRAVEFFFMLSGFFFYRSFFKENKGFFLIRLLRFEWKRFKPIAITFSLPFLFSVHYYYQMKPRGIDVGGIFGYLWYVPKLLTALAVYFIMAGLIERLTRLKPEKRRLLFYLFVLILTVIFYGKILVKGSINGDDRALGGVGLGILLSALPAVKNRLPAFLSPLLCTVLVLTVTLLSYLHLTPSLFDSLIILLLFPALIYLAAQAEFKNRVINRLARLSFGIYAYQAIARYVKMNGIVKGDANLFYFVMALAILDQLIQALFKYLWQKKKNSLKAT